ncbi:MAG TPA: DUF2959 domain-containing protein [Acidobacteriota bacterium]|nr:DUF2959 domain-containing protein [Acidobacteriota bacterium]
MIASCVRGMVLGILAIAALAGCTSQRIALSEKFGYAKREQLVDRVEDARDGQEAAKQQFESALKEFLAVTEVSGAELRELEAQYDKLNREYERSESRAKDVHNRIRKVQQVADALFQEWRHELDQYSNADLRRHSERQLEDTRRQYDRLIEVMETAEARMTPVLAAFKDQVLFLKHNLNARAISSLQQNADRIQSDVGSLVRDMEASIAEANAFIRQMQADK